MRTSLFVIIILISTNSISQKALLIDIVPDETKQKINVLVDGQLFTSYIYLNEIKKPVLWPVVSPGGNEITRNYPLKIKKGERVDHPHHVGIWLNYGDVNGLDFWNNSDAIEPNKLEGYGTIRHQTVEEIKIGKKGLLTTTSYWNDHSGNTVLNETTHFNISATEHVRIIDRTTTLTAKSDKVTFTDNKEGMFALRVTRELELPNDKPLKVSDAHGEIIKVDTPDNDDVTGNYLSSEGIEGEAVWGTRAKWMKLSGKINREKVAIVIFDHPDNPGYPTHWHARTYGLFAANTLGQKIFSKGEMELNFILNQSESVTFRYILAVFSEDPSIQEIEKLSTSFK